MKSEDYKAIAEIINEEIRTAKIGSDIVYKDSIVKRFADYFKKEDEENQPTKGVWNKEEFLKDCGVEK